MLQINNLSKTFGSQTLFESITLSLNKGEKVGLVGRNGSGKSSLFRMILGEIDPDEGHVSFPKGYQIGTLPQHIHFTQKTVLEEACLALSEEEKYDVYKIEKLLSGLGFSEDDFQKDPAQFSGGFQIRINLAKTLVQNPDLLLLDEPTNYLDIVSQRWLAKYINNLPGEVILISHDRDFMDQTCDSIMGLHRGQLRKYQGDTNNYYGKIIEEEELFEKQRINQENQKKHLEKYINRFRASARRASQAQSRIKKLAKFENLESLSALQDLKFTFNYAACPAKTLMSIKELYFSYDGKQYLIDDLSFSIGSKDRIGIIGKNGKGKSTLLNILGNHLQKTEGEITSHPNLEIGHFGQTNIHQLNEKWTIEKEIEESNPKLDKTTVRNICGTMMFDQDLAKKEIKILSGGERSRVLLGKILAKPCNLLLLDEPTNHLDQESIEGLIEGIEDFEGALTIVTHSEMILRRLVNKLIIFHKNRVEFFDGDYDFFLRQYGWEDDSDSMTSSQNISKPVKSEKKLINLSKKEIKKIKAEIIQERSGKLKPLKTEMMKLEREIVKLEKTMEEENQNLIEASGNQNVDNFVKLSKSIKENQKIIDKNFSELEKVTLKHDELEKNFQEKLDELT